MHEQPYLRYSPCVEVALAIAGFPTEDAVVVEELEARESESRQSSGENEEEDEVVPLGEADGIVDLAGSCHESVGWGSGWLNHCGQGILSGEADTSKY